MAKPLMLAEAEEDYAEAFSYYAERSPRAASGFKTEFAQAMEIIEQRPRSCAKWDSRHRYYLMRRYPYLVVFREEPQGTVIVAVAHGKRRPGFWRGR